MLVGAHDGRIDEQVLHVSVTAHGLGNALEHRLLVPAGEAYIRPMPMSELGRQVAPGTTGTHDPEDGSNEPPIVLGRATPITGLAWQQLFNARPLIIAQHRSVHPDSAQKSGYDHISFSVNSPFLSHLT